MQGQDQSFYTGGVSLRICALSGSLRKGSFNTSTLLAAQQVASDGMTMELASLEGIPIYNQDIEENEPVPEAVAALHDLIRDCDGLLIATPEYNYSVPGPLKNAIDWISRLENPFDQKPLGIVSASRSLLGGARAQYHLRQVAVAVNMRVMNRPEVMIASAHERFDEKGNLVHEPTKDLLAKFMGSLRKWVEESQR